MKRSKGHLFMSESCSTSGLRVVAFIKRETRLYTKASALDCCILGGKAEPRVACGPRLFQRSMLDRVLSSV